MSRRYVAFDIETSKDVPGDDFNWKPHRPLGIACAATLPSDAKSATLWHGKSADGTPAERLSPSEAKALVDHLTRLVAEGYTLLTWNGIGFDLDILAEESDLPDVCRQLAWDHVDMMFHIFCDRGFPVALERAAEALRIAGKPPGMSGLLAPKFWAQGRHQEVLDYVAHDVRITLEVALMCEKQRRFQWKTRKGSASSMSLADGWLTVRDALGLPTPDTSWMTNPIPRSRFAQWLTVR